MEERLEELFKSLQEPRRKIEFERLYRELAALSKAVELKEGQRKYLEEAAEKAAAIAAKEWLVEIEETMRKSWGGNLQIQNVEAMIRTPSNLVRNNTGMNHIPAIERREWVDAVAKILDATQKEKYRADLGERQRQFEEQIKNLVDATRDRTREQIRLGLEGTVAAISTTISLSEARIKKLQELAEKTAHELAKPVELRARRMLMEFDEMRRRQVLRTNSLYIAPNEKDDPEEQLVWQEGLKEVLNPQELTIWRALCGERVARRMMAEARLLVWTMDEAVAFTKSQREKLLPLAHKAVQENLSVIRRRRPNVYINYNVQTYYQLARSIDEEELSKILDARQLQRWREVCAMTGTARNTIVNVRLATPTSAKQGQTAAAADPEELEAANSAYLYALAERERERMESEVLVRAEDAIRIAGAEGAAARRLRLAAKGAIRREFENWMTNISGSIRNQARNVSLETIQQWLENMRHNFRFSVQWGRQNSATLWEKTLQSELLPSQMEVWESELKARDEFKNETGGSYVLTQMDELCVLTTKQWDYLVDAMERVLTKYGVDLEEMFSPGSVWFGQSHYMLVPICGIPESELLEVLSEAQMKRFMESEQYANANQYWEHIETRNQQRERERKQREGHAKKK